MFLTPVNIVVNSYDTSLLTSLPLKIYDPLHHYPLFPDFSLSSMFCLVLLVCTVVSSSVLHILRVSLLLVSRMLLRRRDYTLYKPHVVYY